MQNSFQFSCTDIEICVIRLIMFHFSFAAFQFLDNFYKLSFNADITGKSLSRNRPDIWHACQDLIKLCAILNFPAQSLCQTIIVSRCASFGSSVLLFTAISIDFLEFRFPKAAERINHRIMQTNWSINFSHWLRCTFWAGWGRRKSRTKQQSPQHFSFLHLCFAEPSMFTWSDLCAYNIFIMNSESEVHETCNCARSNMWLTIWTRWSSESRPHWCLQTF